jgi:hypothetical protein
MDALLASPVVPLAAAAILLLACWPLSQAMRRGAQGRLEAYLVFTATLILVATLVFWGTLLLGTALLPAGTLDSWIAAIAVGAGALAAGLVAAAWFVRRPPRRRRMPR